MLSMSILLTGVLVVLPVDRASADPSYGPDGYFSTLSAGALPIVDKDNETPGIAKDGWLNTRRIMFGKQGSTGTYGGAAVSGGYKTLAKGAVASVANADFGPNSGSSKSATTSVAANEVLLWADDTVTAGFKFETNASLRNSFDSATDTYESNLAQVSDAVGAANYSVLEQGLLRPAKLEGVCTAAPQTGCGTPGGGTYAQQKLSENLYKVFPLSIGDVRQYFNHTTGWVADPNLACPADRCSNNALGTWLRSGNWYTSNTVFGVRETGTPSSQVNTNTDRGLRPAVRLKLDDLLLSADSGDQGQSATGDLRLTFVDAAAGSLGAASAVASKGRLTLSGSHGLSDGFGFKLVDPAEPTRVVASGLSASGVVDVSGLPGVVSGKAYDVYWWGQENGSAAEGWSNRATAPQMASLTFDFPSYGIELTGQTVGGLKAYRIGEYAETVFEQTGALKSVELSTPAGVKSVLATAAGTAGGSNVDVDDPMGWVAARWLGYPTDPLSDDVTSAYSPYAGKLQLFAQSLAGKSDAELGGLKGSLPFGTFTSPTTQTLPVSGPGLYLIVDSSGTSLPIIVGTKVFNEDVGEDGSYVDFVDAGVKGKPRLGQAAMKTTVTDVAKRILNDPGMDGFDVGSGVEYEIAVRVPDLSDAGFASVSYSAYEFAVADVAEAGLSLPAASGVKVLMDVDPVTGVPSPDTDVTGTAGLSVGVSAQTLSVSGLKAVFAEDAGGHVANRAALPAGSLMRIRYRAVLNAGASYSLPGGGGLDSNENTVTLTRSMSDGSPETRSATANVYTFKVDLVKVDKDEESKKLGGVGFEVSRDGQALKFLKVSDGVFRLDAAGGTAVATHTDGTLSLLGVEARELSFKETVAPSGYFKVSDFGVDVRPVWDADATQVTKVTYATSGTNLAYVSQNGKQVMVLDPAWSLANLPYTGGIGILVLLIVGGLILAFAIRPYILSKRAERDANLV
jgi:hypothetical protein